MTIKNGKESQTLSFGYSCLKALGELWGLNGIQAVVSKVLLSFAPFFDDKGNKIVEEIPFETIDIFIDIIKAASGEDDFNGKNYGDFIFENMDQLGKIIEAFVKSLPQEKKLKALK